ncbi:MAG: 1-deoxy-D-xylulose-5-phosphate synthase [Fusobacteria bacterium]|nr:1-deoxy-D-xylulose-5-phosphate synthase [Fusobacteriota bacterium]
MLEKINSPEDLRQIEEKDLIPLCQEIREYIEEVVKKNGGHLASNLGAVELTVAQHRIFNSPKDKIIFDVGHQSYTHKILTGRYEAFKTIRQFKGLSGFPKRKESSHDILDTGHSSTSISAALGMATVRDLKGEKYDIIVNIGDGALSGGMALEALNHEGHINKNIIIVLNDNEMSISEPIGAIAKQLTKISSGSYYRNMKYKLTSELIKTSSGRYVRRGLSRVKGLIKYWLSSKGIFFENFGFTYLGPYDGHDIIGLEEGFKIAKSIHQPTLIHVITTKGKGVLHAEDDPEKYHGIAPAGNKKLKSFTNIFGEHLLRLAQKNENITAITAAMCTGTGLEKFREKLPDRFFDVSIAEQHGLTFAAGQAIAGFHPVIAIYSTFMQRGVDQVIHDICMQNLPVTMVLDRAGLVGEDGETHHGVFDINLFGNIPNLIFMEPKDGNELQDMLDYAVHFNGPVMIRFPKGNSYMEKDDQIQPIELGKMEYINQSEDNKIGIISLGNEFIAAQYIKEHLEIKGINVDLINSRFITPLNQDMLASLEKYEKIFTIENHVVLGGFGSLLKSQLQKPMVYCYGLPNEFIEHGSISELRHDVGFTKERILNNIEAILNV